TGPVVQTGPVDSCVIRLCFGPETGGSETRPYSGRAASCSGPSSTAAPLGPWFTGTLTSTVPLQLAPLASVAVKFTWYTRPLPPPMRSARSSTTDVPMPWASGAKLPLPGASTASSEKTLSMVIVMASPSGSVTPRISTGTNWWFAGHSTLTLGTAAVQTGGWFGAVRSRPTI